MATNRVSFLASRSKSFFVNNGIICCDNGSSLKYRKIDGKWFVETMLDSYNLRLKQASPGLAFELEKQLAMVGGEQVLPKYTLSSSVTISFA